MSNKNHNTEFDQREELLWEAEQPRLDVDAYAPQDLEGDEPGTILNYANNYGSGEPRRKKIYPDRKEKPVLDRNRWEQKMQRQGTVGDVPEIKPPKKRRGCGCLPLLILPVLIIALVAGILWGMTKPPQAETAAEENRKEDTATILLCGTSDDGTRIETMMLMYLSGTEEQVRLLNLPEDSYTITAAGETTKLNSAYFGGSTREAGMEALMDHVAEIIGYRPDSYLLVDFGMVSQLADLMGGIQLDSGGEHLDGEDLLEIVRSYTSGEELDPEQKELQRDVMEACVDQWMTPENIGSAMEAVSILEENSTSSLDIGEYIWIAKTMLSQMEGIEIDSLPGYEDLINQYYSMDPAAIEELINQYYNPYKTPTQDAE